MVSLYNILISIYIATILGRCPLTTTFFFSDKSQKYLEIELGLVFGLRPIFSQVI